MLAVGILVGALLVAVVKQPGKAATTATATGTAAGISGSSNATGGAETPGAGGGPGNSGSSVISGAGSGSAGSGSGRGGTPGSSTTPGAGSGGGGGTVGTASTGCSGVPASGVRGVTSTTIKIGFALPNLGVLAAAVNIGNPQADIEAVLAGMTKAGRLPICGRKIVPDFQSFDVLDPSQSRAACDNFAQDKDFAVISLFGFAAQPCVTQENGMVDLDPGTTAILADFAASPLFFTTDPPNDEELLDTAYWAAKSGYLNGKSIGVYVNQNGPGGPDPSAALVKTNLVDVLARLGHPVKDYIVSNTTLSSSAPTAADPNDTTAVERFKTDGIQVVFPLEFSQNFFNQAEAQDYHPQWLVYSTGMASDATTSTYPPSLSGALGLLWEQVGEQATGIPNTSETQTCFGYYTQAGNGSPPAVDSAAGQTLRESCDPVDIMVRALTAVGDNLTTDTLVAGMRTVQSVPESYFSPQSFTAAKPWGASENLSVGWHSNCSCWKLVSGFVPLYSPS